MAWWYAYGSEDEALADLGPGGVGVCPRAHTDVVARFRVAATSAVRALALVALREPTFSSEARRSAARQLMRPQPQVSWPCRGETVGGSAQTYATRRPQCAGAFGLGHASGPALGDHVARLLVLGWCVRVRHDRSPFVGWCSFRKMCERGGPSAISYPAPAQLAQGKETETRRKMVTLEGC